MPTTAIKDKKPKADAKKESRYVKPAPVSQKLFEPVPRETSGDPEYILECTILGKATQYKCTESLYRRAKTNEYHKMVRHEFMMGVNLKTNVLEFIEVVEKPDFFSQRGGSPVNNPNDVPGEMADNVHYMIISLRDPELVQVKTRPASMSQDTVDEIREYFQGKPKVRNQDIILDRFLIADIRNEGELIYIDPKEL